MKEIIVCMKCNGDGVIVHEELVNYHKRDYATWTETCAKCKGSGMLCKITTVKFEPHHPSKPTPRGT